MRFTNEGTMVEGATPFSEPFSSSAYSDIDNSSSIAFYSALAPASLLEQSPDGTARIPLHGFGVTRVACTGLPGARVHRSHLHEHRNDKVPPIAGQRHPPGIHRCRASLSPTAGRPQAHRSRQERTQCAADFASGVLLRNRKLTPQRIDCQIAPCIKREFNQRVKNRHGSRLDRKAVYCLCHSLMEAKFCLIV